MVFWFTFCIPFEIDEEVKGSIDLNLSHDNDGRFPSPIFLEFAGK